MMISVFKLKQKFYRRGLKKLLAVSLKAEVLKAVFML